MYPKNDEQFEETTIVKVKKGTQGWIIGRSDGWSFLVPKDSPEPKKGMTARFYGKGIGSSVRGLFLNGRKVFYRTEEEQKEKSEIDIYGADAADWLKRWDEGLLVWTIEMGGLGPGYEQCIHITCAEILRIMLTKGYDSSKWDDIETWKKDREEIEQMSDKNPIIKALGLSGAQWGAALNLAGHFYRRGPRTVMKDERTKNRRIQVERTFPESGERRNMKPTVEDKRDGLKSKYQIRHADGTPCDENAVYFVLRLDFHNGCDPDHIKACRCAARTYAGQIIDHLPALSADLLKILNK